MLYDTVESLVFLPISVSKPAAPTYTLGGHALYSVFRDEASRNEFGPAPPQTYMFLGQPQMVHPMPLFLVLRWCNENRLSVKHSQPASLP